MLGNIYSSDQLYGMKGLESHVARNERPANPSGESLWHTATVLLSVTVIIKALLRIEQHIPPFELILEINHCQESGELSLEHLPTKISTIDRSFTTKMQRPVSAARCIGLAYLWMTMLNYL